MEYDDPNVTIEAILDVVGKSAAKMIDLDGNRLKQGFGHEVIWTLTVLADRALAAANQQPPSTPIVIKDNDGDENQSQPEIDDENEINFDDQFTFVEDVDEFATAEDEPIVDVIGGNLVDNVNRPKAILTSQTDFADWKLEVERVLPQLKVVIRSSDQKADWRVHYNSVSFLFVFRGETTGLRLKHSSSDAPKTSLFNGNERGLTNCQKIIKFVNYRLNMKGIL